MITKRGAWTVGAIALVALVGGLCARHVQRARRSAREAATLAAAVSRGDSVLHVPRSTGSITLDGDTDDPGWTKPPGAARTGDFLMENGNPARPFSQTRLVWGDDYLYLALYASDEDIESKVDRADATVGPNDDAFHLVFHRDDTEYAFDLSPTGMVTDAIRRGGGAWEVSWNAGAHASREMDGSLNDAHNLDEEWEIELAIPLASLGLRGERGENLGMSLHRCDTPKEWRRVCAGWGDGQDGRHEGWIVLE